MLCVLLAVAVTQTADLGVLVLSSIVLIPFLVALQVFLQSLQITLDLLDKVIEDTFWTATYW